MKFFFGCEHKKSSIIPQRLYSCWDFFSFFFPTGDGANREQRLFVADSFSDHPQLADSADPPRAAPAINPHRSFISASLEFCCCRRRCCCCCYTAATPAVVAPFWWGVGQLIDDPCEHLVSARPPPARHHAENMWRVAARTRPGSILSLWSSEVEIIK